MCLFTPLCMVLRSYICKRCQISFTIVPNHIEGIVEVIECCLAAITPSLKISCATTVIVRLTAWLSWFGTRG